MSSVNGFAYWKNGDYAVFIPRDLTVIVVGVENATIPSKYHRVRVVGADPAYPAALRQPWWTEEQDLRKIRVALVESDDAFRAQQLYAFGQGKLELHGHATGDDCIDHLSDNEPDLVVTAEDLDGTAQGKDVLLQTRIQRGANTAVFGVGNSDQATAEDGLPAGIEYNLWYQCPADNVIDYVDFMARVRTLMASPLEWNV